MNDATNATGEHRQFAVHTPLGDDILLLRGMTTHEELASPYLFDLELLSDDFQIDHEAIVGQPVAVRVEVGPKTRFFHGFVNRFVQMTPLGRRARYSATVVPELWFLTRTADCRIFQGMSVPEIVKTVLREFGLRPVDDRLIDTYPAREYCVQYRESYFDFLSRLMEEEGIYYFFEHSEDAHQMVLCDAQCAHGPFLDPEEVSFLPPDPYATRPGHIYDWTVETQVQPGEYALNDFDPTAPRKDLLVRNGPELPPIHAHSGYEVYEFPGNYDERKKGQQAARVRIEELHTWQKTATGRATARNLATGHTFRLQGHPDDRQNGSYLVVAMNQRLQLDDYETTQEAQSKVDFDTSFTVIPEEKQFRPARRTQRPTVDGPQTAIVVGGADAEVWTNADAQIKVLFHWDRHGTADESAGCWLRVGQDLAGNRWGTMFIPRVGQEVIVEFLEGDPQRPLVTGCVYNGCNRPPFDLPQNQNVSGVKTCSTPDGTGYNELSFDDTSGSERIDVHAERDMDTAVGNDRRDLVGNDQHVIVKRDRKELIEVDLHQDVKRDHQERIGRDRHTMVRGKEAKSVGGGLSLTVNGDVNEVFKRGHTEEVTEKYTLKGMELAFESMTAISFKCGSSSLVLDPMGITVTGPLLTLDGSMVRIASGPGTEPLEAESASAVHPAPPEAPEEAGVGRSVTPCEPTDDPAVEPGGDGGKGKRLPPFVPTPGDPCRPDSDEETWIEIELVDDDGIPLPGEPYEIVLPDGRLASGTVDEKGCARIDGISPGDCAVSFPSLDGRSWTRG